MSECSTVGCERPILRREWCRTHYRRYLKTGDAGGEIRTPARLEGERPAVCEVDGCDRATQILTLCKAHYERRYRYGDVGNAKVKVTSMAGHSLAERLENVGWTVTSDGCWEWDGGRDALGYGFIGIRSRRHLAHRVAHEAWIGPLTPGLVVMHQCDNPPCINPEHLREGTFAENTADMIAKGRARFQAVS